MKYDPEIESWMKTFYDSLPPTEQRRYAAVEALKLDADEDGIQYIVELLGCDPHEVDRARQEFVDGQVESALETDFTSEVGDAALGIGSDPETIGETEKDATAVAVSTESEESSPETSDEEADDQDFFGAAHDEDQEAREAAAAFWQEDGASTEEQGFAMAPSDVIVEEGFGGFGDDVAETDGEAASAVLEAAGSSSKKRAKKKGPGPIANVLGIVIFGVIGIVAGYAILVFAAPDKAKQLFDWENARDRGLAYFSSESAEQSDNTPGPRDPDREFQPGGMLTNDDNDLEDYQKDRPKKPNGKPGNGGNRGGNAQGNGEDLNDPFAINPPDSIDITDPELENPDDPFAIPEIGEPEFSNPGIGDPLALPETDSGARLIQPVAEVRYSTTEIDAAIAEVVSLSDDPEIKFSRVYLKLCEVGNRLAQPTEAARAGAEDRKPPLEAFLTDIATSRDKLITVGNFSYDLLYSGKRPANVKGALIAGTITNVESLQGGHKATVLLLDPEKRNMTVTVVSDDVANYAKGDKVMVLGTIITEPSTELVNYDGDESPIVYPAVTTKL